MSAITDFVQSVAADAFRDLLTKAQRKLSRRTRRRRRVSASTATLRKIERLLLPAKKQVSRRRTLAARSKARRRQYAR